jgi:hypothetical protein
MALGFVFSLYLVLTLSAIAYFGADHIMPSLFDNFSSAPDISSKFILGVFLLVLLTNIPFALFVGKTGLIAMITILVSFKRDDDDFVAAETSRVSSEPSTRCRSL